jgi:hypothetical protein
VRTVTGHNVRMVVAIVGIALVATACAGVAPASLPTPAATSATPVESTSSPTPSSAGLVIALANSTGNDVSVAIDAPQGLVLGAESGIPGDGASVEPYRLHAGNDDATTIRLIWTGGPCDVRDRLAIDPDLGRLVLVQPECPGDAVAFDRVLVVHLARPIDAASLHAVVQDGIDTE